MNDIVLRDFAEKFPTCAHGLRRAVDIFDQVQSFEDVERLFLRGAGLSPNTYRSYLTAVKQFYQFSHGLNPFQVTPADIEAFYDDLVKHGDRNTAYLRIRGLKRFFAGIRNVINFYTSPFDMMENRLVKKLNRTKKGNRAKKALSKAEIRRLLAWLQQDRTAKGQGDYALFFMLVTSGLRASEAAQLRWSDLGCFEGAWTAQFIGKGDKDAEQELYTPAVEATRNFFRTQFARNPIAEDALFLTAVAFPGDKPRPMNYHCIWDRITKLGERARAEGILTRDIRITPHTLRRSYATNLYRAGMKIKAIQEKTRHASIDVLVKHYIDDSEPATPYLAQIIG